MTQLDYYNSPRRPDPPVEASVSSTAVPSLPSGTGQYVGGAVWVPYAAHRSAELRGRRPKQVPPSYGDGTEASPARTFVDETLRWCHP